MQRDPVYDEFLRPIPEWFTDAKLGIFMHWGAYSVPAWAEPIGAHGTFSGEGWEQHFNTHNPYSEWYFNTIRIDGSPAQQHHREVYGDAAYDDFLDAWRAEDFDADDLLALVAQTGARYFVPTTKHHDGITLWDAPGTGDRNTVARGPRRDLVGEMRAAAVRHDVRFGVYYSGGLDWHFDSGPAIFGPLEEAYRPVSDAYAAYAHEQVADLITRYAPDMLWCDIEWPDAGKSESPYGLPDLFRRFYAARPDGVVNDRWGNTHWDFRTSEYEMNHGAEDAAAWENCRGIGYSFAHNRLEDETQTMTGENAVRYFVDVVSRGGNLLLNIGPTAGGLVPPLQRATLEALGEFNAAHADAIFGSRPLHAGRATDAPWVRWTQRENIAYAFIDAPAGERVALDVDRDVVDVPETVIVPAHGQALAVMPFPLR